MSVKTLLRDEIQNELENLKKMELGTDKYRATVDGLTKLTDRLTEIERIEDERKEKIENRDFDNDLKLAQINDERKDRLVRNCISVAGIVVPVVVTVWGTIVSLNFEKEGTVTSIVGRGFINKLLPRK